MIIKVLLRGINLGLLQYSYDDVPISTDLYEGGKCPPNLPHYVHPPVCGVDSGKGKFNQSTAPNTGNDLAQIRELGFDLIRLCKFIFYIYLF